MLLSNLKNTSRPYKRRKLLGRGIGSKSGKTSGRGQKGAGSRSGWQARSRYEGGQLPLYRKFPERGFSNARFQSKLDVVNLKEIEKLFNDGEIVSVQTLKQKKFLKGQSNGLKVLAHGDLTKKVMIQASAYSSSAEAKLKALGISYTVV
jgi:large subunit ribosomal protein L15